MNLKFKVAAVTRPAKKDRERRILAAHMKCLGLETYEIVDERERPDFIVRATVGRIGVEVTEYHAPARSNRVQAPIKDAPHGKRAHPRKVVEATFDEIRRRVEKYRADHSDLGHLSIYLRFKELWLPSRAEIEPFIFAVRDVIAANTAALSAKHLEIRIGADGPAILRKYVQMIVVRRCRSKAPEWRSNLGVGGVGTSEADLLATIQPKLEAARMDGLSENHLIVTSGETIGSIMAIRSAKQLDGFTALNAALDAGPYDEVALLDYGAYARKRFQPWRTTMERGRI